LLGEREVKAKGQSECKAQENLGIPGQIGWNEKQNRAEQQRPSREEDGSGPCSRGGGGGKKRVESEADEGIMKGQEKERPEGQRESICQKREKCPRRTGALRGRTGKF